MIRCRVLPVFLAAALSLGLPQIATAQAPSSKSFQAWLDDVRAEGVKRGISTETLDAALTGLTPIERVIKLDRRQPEFVQTFQQYVDKRVNDWRIQTGRERFATHAALLKEVGGRFGVQPRFIVALWGIETNFGRHTGGFSVVRALATLAFDGRRSAYFRKELFNALTIIDQGHISASEMKGSWAGAMGQSQFMPSSFLSYAVDYNGDGRRDIWGTTADVFASAANYLKKAGWQDDQTWGRKVNLPEGLAARIEEFMPKSRPRGCRALRKLTVTKKLSEWQALGVRRADGSALPTRDLEASLIVPDGPGGPAYLVYRNFRTTLRWNCSISFAAAVGILADRIARR
jgi:membrane-bound lytic murein transglycosylase B